MGCANILSIQVQTMEKVKRSIRAIKKGLNRVVP